MRYDKILRFRNWPVSTSQISLSDGTKEKRTETGNRTKKEWRVQKQSRNC